MPGHSLLEIQDISLRVEPGELAVLTDVPGDWAGLSDRQLVLSGDDISTWGADVRLKAGLFFTSGRPETIPGVRAVDLVHRIASASESSDLGAAERQELIDDWCQRLDVPSALTERFFDAGFSDAEGLAIELLQLALLRSDASVIDLASAPVTNASRTIAGIGLRQIRIDQPAIALVLVTNDRELIDNLAPNHIHHLNDSSFVRADRDETLL